MRTDRVRYESFTGWVDPPADVRPGLAGDLDCQVAVIGGGINGMSTALRLTERGRDVVLLEAEFCGHGSSSRTPGSWREHPAATCSSCTLPHQPATDLDDGDDIDGAPAPVDTDNDGVTGSAATSYKVVRVDSVCRSRGRRSRWRARRSESTPSPARRPPSSPAGTEIVLGRSIAGASCGG